MSVVDGHAIHTGMEGEVDDDYEVLVAGEFADDETVVTAGVREGVTAVGCDHMLDSLVPSLQWLAR